MTQNFFLPVRWAVVLVLLAASLCACVALPEQTTTAQTSAPASATEEPAVPSTTQHVHDFLFAGCMEPKRCLCGETEGEPLGHSWEDATCTAAKYCTVCELTEGEPAGHRWEKATCTEPKHCAHCDLTDGKPAGHQWKDATYTKPRTCAVCNLTSGSPKEVPGKENYHGHVYTGGSGSVKYHYEANCAGKYSHEITWEEVERRGLGPCGTCVLH